jgi:hypothetical protein
MDQVSLPASSTGVAADHDHAETWSSRSTVSPRHPLDTYSHLWPDSDDRTSTTVDFVLFADSVRAEEVVDGHNP